jgi:hypothetical protein
LLALLAHQHLLQALVRSRLQLGLRLELQLRERLVQ